MRSHAALVCLLQMYTLHIALSYFSCEGENDTTIFRFSGRFSAFSETSGSGYR